MQLTTFFSVVPTVLALVGAIPAPVSRRDVFVPPVLYPHNGTIWIINQRHSVTWDTSNALVNITNKFGRIMLRKGDLTTPLIMASGFDILLGSTEVAVPWVVDGDDYRIVLFGDSGNFSPPFSIRSG